MAQLYYIAQRKKTHKNNGDIQQGMLLTDRFHWQQVLAVDAAAST
jgi:hypothetical protein